MKAFSFCMLLAMAAPVLADEPEVAPAPNGIPFPAGYEDWRLLGVSQRTDKNSLRAILGNEIAVAAARRGETNPWPDGTVLAKLAWNQTTHEHWPAAIVPGEASHVEFMLKDAERYAASGGWGYARWLGPDLKPYGENAAFAQECHGCHQAAASSDFVFTRPVSLLR